VSLGVDRWVFRCVDTCVSLSHTVAVLSEVVFFCLSVTCLSVDWTSVVLSVVCCFLAAPTDNRIGAGAGGEKRWLVSRAVCIYNSPIELFLFYNQSDYRSN